MHLAIFDDVPEYHRNVKRFQQLYKNSIMIWSEVSQIGKVTLKIIHECVITNVGYYKHEYIFIATCGLFVLKRIAYFRKILPHHIEPKQHIGMKLGTVIIVTTFSNKNIGNFLHRI